MSKVHTKDIAAAIEKGRKYNPDHFTPFYSFTSRSMGIDPAYGSSAFGIVVTEWADGMIQIMHAEELEKIQILKAIIEDREVITKIENFSAVFDNKEGLEKLINDAKDKPIMITGEEEKVIELLGVRFENINVNHRIENLVVKNPDRIKKKLEYLDDGETAKVEFITGTKNTVITRYSIAD